MPNSTRVRAAFAAVLAATAALVLAGAALGTSQQVTLTADNDGGVSVRITDGGGT